MEDLQSGVGVLQHGALGYLEDERPGGEPRLFERPADVGHQFGAEDLAWRDVDAHGQSIEPVAVPPLAGLAARGVEDLTAELLDEPGFLCEWDEQLRPERSSARVLPSDECLAADDLAGREGDDGLVVDRE